MFLEIGGVGVRVLGRLGAIEGRLWIGCVHGRLGASGTPTALPLEAAGARRGRTVLFPFEASPGPRPIHSSCFLICIFFCMDMPSSDKQGFLFFWASLVRLFSFRSRVRSLGSGVSLPCPLSPKMKGVAEACREI